MPRRSPTRQRRTQLESEKENVLDVSYLAIIAQNPGLERSKAQTIVKNISDASGRRVARILLGWTVRANDKERLRAAAFRQWVTTNHLPANRLQRDCLSPADGTVLAILAEKPNMPDVFADIFLLFLTTKRAVRIGLLLLGRRVRATAQERAASRSILDWMQQNRQRGTVRDIARRRNTK